MRLAELADFRANGRATPGCQGNLANEGYRVVHALHAALTQEAVKTAPPAVREAAAVDSKQLTGQLVDQAIGRLTGEVARTVGAAASNVVGTEAGSARRQRAQA